MKMKKAVSIIVCLGMAVFMASSSTASQNRLFDINPETVETIQVKTGWLTTHLLDTDTHAERIHKIINTLNNFEHTGKEEIEPTSGWYVEINITHTNGAVQSYEFGPGGVFDPDNPEEMMYISAEPDYFGQDWLTLLFPYPFTDVNMWENGAIMSLYDNGFMQGTSETTFSLDSAMTRGMFVTVLGRMAEIAVNDYKTNAFEDVDETDYFSPYIAWAYKTGIVKGNTAQNFSPNDPITKEQAVLMLARFAEKQGKEFSAVSAYSGDFEDVIKYLSDFYETSEEFQQKYQSLFYVVQPSITQFGYSDALTRREAADILESAYHSLYQE